jgi:hypothetical protein
VAGGRGVGGCAGGKSLGRSMAAEIARFFHIFRFAHLNFIRNTV